jgi:hypothetical protein
MQQQPPAFDFQQLLASGDILSGTRLVPQRFALPLRRAILRDGLLKSYSIINSHNFSSASSGPHKMRRGQQVMQVALFDTGFAFRCPLNHFVSRQQSVQEQHYGYGGSNSYSLPPRCAVLQW